MLPWRMRVSFLLRALGLVGLGYLLLCGLIFFKQRALIYFPARGDAAGQERRAAGLGLVAWRSAAGDLLGWRGRAGTGGLRALLFHGNAGSALDRAAYVWALGARGIDLRLVEYPGYGSRAGQPGETAFAEAADQALAELGREGPGAVLVVGESLGGAVACALAARQAEAVRGLLLITPFRSLREVAAAHFPFVPSLLLRDRFEAGRHLRAYHGPVAVLLAGRDEVVGVGQGQALLDGYGGPKRAWLQREATHDGLDLEPGAPFWREAVEFLISG